MTTSSERSLDRFFSRFRDWQRQRTGGLPRTALDPQWPSPAQTGEPDGEGRVAWEPFRQQPPCSFSDLENALELAIHPDVSAFYTRYFAAHVDASFEQGNLTLLFAWNVEDFRLVMGNLIGHALEKRRVRQPFTVFFANIDDSRFLSIDNASGKVMLEILGAHTPLEVAENLCEFVDRLAAPVQP